MNENKQRLEYAKNNNPDKFIGYTNDKRYKIYVKYKSAYDKKYDTEINKVIKKYKSFTGGVYSTDIFNGDFSSVENYKVVATVYVTWID